MSACNILWRMTLYHLSPIKSKLSDAHWPCESLGQDIDALEGE